MSNGPGGAAVQRATVSVAAVEELIQELAGVEGARIILDDWGGVREIHVLADRSRPPKSIVRDIESSLAARWGLIVDHRRISVAQLGDVSRRPKWVRLRLQQLAVTRDPVRGRMEVAVSLAPESQRDAFGRPIHDPELPTTVWSGRAAGQSGGLGYRLAAEATLTALNQSLLPDHGFSLGEMGRFPLGEHEAILCLLHYHAPRGGGETITGSALVRVDPVEAAVRAVLNGTNRIFGVAMRRQFAAVEEDDRSSVTLRPGPASAEVSGGETQAAAAAEAPAENEGPAEARDP